MKLTTSQLKQFLKEEIRDQMAPISDEDLRQYVLQKQGREVTNAELARMRQRLTKMDTNDDGIIDTAEIGAGEKEVRAAPQRPQWTHTPTNLQQAASGDYYRGPFLRSGHRGKGVRQVQRALNAKGYDLKADGKFGGATHRAVVSFQKSIGAKYGTRGLVGPETGTALLGGSTRQPEAPAAGAVAPAAGAVAPAAGDALPTEVELQFNPNKPPRHKSKSPLIQLLKRQKPEHQTLLIKWANNWRKEYDMDDDQLAAALIKMHGKDLDLSDEPMEKPEGESYSATSAAARQLGIWENK